MSEEQRGLRAVAARALLDDPTVQEGFAYIAEELTAEWRKSHDSAARENLWLALNIVDRLQDWLRSAASHDLTALKRTK